jgi:hypothetical protein
MNMATLIVQLYESNYPELLRRVYVINGNLRPIINMLIFFYWLLSVYFCDSSKNIFRCFRYA